MAQWKKWLVTLVGLFGVVALLGFIKYNQVMAAIAFGESFPEPSETVKAMRVEKTRWQPRIEVVGEVRAMQNTMLRNELEGLIADIRFRGGDKVEAGQLLLRFDTRVEDADLTAVQAEIRLAELILARQVQLRKESASAQEDLERAQAQLAVLEARATALQATIAKKTLLAPYSGTTSIHDWQVGTFLAQNTDITRLVGDLSEVWVSFSVPQQHAALRIGQQVEVGLSSTDTQRARATIVALDPQLDINTRSLSVRASVDNRALNWRPGMFVRVQVPADEVQEVFALPSSAVRYDSFGSFVYVLRKDDNQQLRAQRQAVETLAREDQTTYLRADSLAGQQVATTGAAKLSAGTLVQIAE